jgi:hypothetical protein
MAYRHPLAVAAGATIGMLAIAALAWEAMPWLLAGTPFGIFGVVGTVAGVFLVLSAMDALLSRYV